MKTTIEADRIRLVAENDADNQAICAINNLYCASGDRNDDIGNDMGCFIDEGTARNWVCIPLENICEMLAFKSGHLVYLGQENN